MTVLTNALRAYQQADEDGVMVLVSRQACEEGAAEIERLRNLLLTGLALHGGAAHTHSEKEWRTAARDALGIEHEQ